MNFWSCISSEESISKQSSRGLNSKKKRVFLIKKIKCCLYWCLSSVKHSLFVFILLQCDSIVMQWLFPMASYQQEYFEINNVFTIETVVVSFVLEDGGIYIIILLRNEPVFLSLEKAYIGELRHFLSGCTQNWPSALCHHQVRWGSLVFFWWP